MIKDEIELPNGMEFMRQLRSSKMKVRHQDDINALALCDRADRNVYPILHRESASTRGRSPRQRPEELVKALSYENVNAIPAEDGRWEMCIVSTNRGKGQLPP